MCFSRPSTPDYAAEDRDREEQRQGQVRAGTDAVNQSFSRFTPQYFQNLGDSFRAYYQPQLDRQAQGARRAVELSFAGNPASSAANRNAANLERDRVLRAGELEAGAADAVRGAKRTVEGQRGDLLNLAEAGSSVENVASQAISQSRENIGTPQFSPLGDLFGKYTGLLGSAARSSDAGGATQPFWQRQIDFLRGGSSSGGGSQTIVGGGR